MQRLPRMKRIVTGMSSVMDIPLTVKIRTGVSKNTLIAQPLIPKLISWGASAITVSLCMYGNSAQILSMTDIQK